MTPEAFISRELDAGRLTLRHLVRLTEEAQRALGLEVDGMPGTRTRAALDGSKPLPKVLVCGVGCHPGRDRCNGYCEGRTNDPPPGLPTIAIDGAGWMSGEGVERIPSDPSWYYPTLATPKGTPRAIVAHYTATARGTGESMAIRRIDPRGPDDRAASWHVSIDYDGQIIQQAPLTVGCWHCRATPQARELLGMPPNRCSVGIELVGDGEDFPEPQVRAAARVWRAICESYQIPAGRAMVQHSELDPGRRRDPGPVWMRRHAPRVLEYIHG